MNTATELRNAGFAVEVKGGEILVGLNNRPVSRNEVASVLELLKVEPAELRQVGARVAVRVKPRSIRRVGAWRYVHRPICRACKGTGLRHVAGWIRNSLCFPCNGFGWLQAGAQ